MFDFNIKCNNLKEAEFVISYIMKKGFKYSYYAKYDISQIYDIEYPIIIFKMNEPFDFEFGFWKYYEFNFNEYKATEAKILMRQDKLNRINE